MSRTSIAGDFHIPYQDTELVNKWLQHIKDTNPDRVIINGDLMDAGMLSKFDKVPGIDQSFKAEVELTKTFFESLRKVTDNEIVYLEGNHSFRLKKYLIDCAPELWEFEELSLESLLDLERFDVEYIGLDEKYSTFQDNYFENQDFLIGHFSLARTGLGATAKGLMEKYGKNIWQAHVHRFAYLAKWQYDKQIIGVEGGCMCKLDNNYRRNVNWQAGFGDIVDGEVEMHAFI